MTNEKPHECEYRHLCLEGNGQDGCEGNCKPLWHLKSADNGTHCSNGPVSTMPGSMSSTDQPCDDHPDRPAVNRVQTETDSFGCEYAHLCQECIDKMRAEVAAARCGKCDWCKKDVTDLSPRRDYDEGMSGPVYDVCGECCTRANERARAELEESSRYRDYD